MTAEPSHDRQGPEMDPTIQDDNNETSTSSISWKSAVKLGVSCALLMSAVSTLQSTYSNTPINSQSRRKLSAESSSTEASNAVPTFTTPLLSELAAREKLFADTPPEEVKYWFEYAGPLQKYHYRYSKSRGKTDSFEGRDDSGVTSARFIESAGAGPDYQSFFQPTGSFPDHELPLRSRLMQNCLAMGAATRPKTGVGSVWYDWFGSASTDETTLDRCRVLFVVNTVGAGKGPTMLWETPPPKINAAGPQPWRSEQETAAMHLERNLKEIDSMCANGQIAARVQILVCEPIPGKWTDWMDSMLPHCGGKIQNDAKNYKENPNPYDAGIEVEERPSPVQVVVVASADTADTCHDLKSGFMEQRMQDLILAPPHLGANPNDSSIQNLDPSVKTTHPDLISSDDHDLYVAMKWSSLVTVRTVSSFLQSSADLAAAAASPHPKATVTSNLETPLSSLLIPSFVRVSYVSEENNKVAKWRMHGDFFHPAAWEVSKDSYEMTWIPDSLSSTNGISAACKPNSKLDATSRKLTEADDDECGQWWIVMTEEQMSTNPEIFANEATPPLVRGGSNFVWMITEAQRKQLVTRQVCELDKSNSCGAEAQAVIPLGDLESHLVNFMPNTALGKKHEDGRRPGYSKGDKLERDREMVRERKQLKGQEDIEKALFDYTIYPAALFHKDATLKAARSRDEQLSGKTSAKEEEEDSPLGPKTIMSGYYDVTITKPRASLPSWCQNLARRGLCSLHADYFRESKDQRCWEACGMRKNWKRI